MNVVEQIVICKMMLFSYIYHHAKVRAAEGVLERLLRRMLARWRSQGVNDNVNLDTFFGMTDAALSNISKNDEDPIVKEYAYRVENRFLPREVYSISGPSATHAARVIIRDFLLLLHDRTERQRAIADLETAIGEELIKIKPELGTDVDRALAVAGVWVDAPKPPKFEDVDAVMVSSKNTISGVAMAQAFPIREWTEAYEHYRYQVRIFAFSEYWELTRRAGKTAMQRILKISGDSFYEAIGRDRD